MKSQKCGVTKEIFKRTKLKTSQFLISNYIMKPSKQYGISKKKKKNKTGAYGQMKGTEYRAQIQLCTYGQLIQDEGAQYT